MGDRASHAGCGIYYAITATPKYYWLALRSARSVRKFNREIPITLCVFGDTAALDTSEARTAGVELAVRPESLAGVETWAKWKALRQISYPRALYLDVDTTCFADPMHLFDRYGDADFSAREELGAAPGSKPYLVGNKIQYPQVDWPRFLEIRAQFESRVLPLFNTGVMLFGHGAAPRIAARLEVAERLRQLWAANELPYPCTNRYITEQLCASVMLGTVPDLRTATMLPEDAPMYMEWLGRAVPGRGSVMHVWNNYLPFHIAEFDGEDVALEYDRFAAGPKTPVQAPRLGHDLA